MECAGQNVEQDCYLGSPAECVEQHGEPHSVHDVFEVCCEEVEGSCDACREAAVFVEFFFHVIVYFLFLNVRCVVLPSAKFAANHGGGHGYVEAVGGGRFGRIVWDAQPLGDLALQVYGDAAAFVAHDDESVGCEVGVVDVFAVEQGAVHGIVGRQAADELWQGGVDEVHVCEAAHRGLHCFGVVGVGGAGAAIDAADAEPMGNAYDGAEVSGVLHVVECEAEFFAAGLAVWVVLGDGKQGEHFLRVLHEADFAQFFV